MVDEQVTIEPLIRTVGGTRAGSPHAWRDFSFASPGASPVNV